MSDGSYELGIKGYKGMLITRVIDIDPKTPDYIDEAKRKKVSFGDRQIYSTIFIGSETDSADNNQQIRNFITPLSSLSSYNLGVKFEQDRLIMPSIIKNISAKDLQATISSENRKVARALCEEDKDITFIEPKPIISSDKDFQVGNGCGNALAAISGLESIYATTNESPLTKIISNLSASLFRAVGKNYPYIYLKVISSGR
ncbi:MAG: hypothetical protein P8J25_04655 [Porticoccaceae bacterium]|nr:hypothetical protein [Porticoccaceae bacterium]